MSELKTLESMFKLMHMCKRNVHRQLEQLNLDIAPMHVRVIKIINKREVCTAMDIATCLDRDKAQVTRLINTLIELDYVQKMPNPDDKRSQCLLITEKGQGVIEHIKTIDRAVADKLTVGISEQDLQTFERITKAMSGNLCCK